MKKHLYLLAFAIFSFLSSKAAPGDTTWVQANITNLEGYNNYDTAVTFPAPGTTYRKIYMIFTLGKHTCPGYTYGTGSVPWCADWDYTVQNYLMTPTGDTMELSRLITPYANGGGGLPNMPYTWTQRYIYDVTDYASKLHDAAAMRIFYSGYSGGFTANIKFAFIEGTPERNVTGITRLWNGSFAYGDTTHGDSNNINTHFATLSETAPAGTQSGTLKFTITGHGGDVLGCSEFCQHNYYLAVNGTTTATKQIWRDNCGANELYPQSGTWLLERANWCPGALVYPYYHDLGVTDGAAYNVGITFDPYVSVTSSDAPNAASYTTEAQVFYYGAINKTLDASLDDVVSPTNYEGHFRENPLAGPVVLHIRNSGSTAITSMKIEYKVDDSTAADYDWSGNIASLTDTDVYLPELSALQSLAGSTGTHTFTAKILTVNGATDDDATNNTITSSFNTAPVWPTKFIINFNTNSEGSALGFSETNWQLFNGEGEVVAGRTSAHTNSTYVDTLNLVPGSYKLVVADGSCDGLSWWVFAEEGISDGSFTVKKYGSVTTIPLNGNQYTGGYRNDFGCGFIQYFVAMPDTTLSVQNVSSNVTFQAYPNPAQNEVAVDIDGLQNVKGTIKIIDMVGRTIVEQPCSSTHTVLNTSAIASGVYTIIYTDGTDNSLKWQSRLLIANK